MSADSIVTVNPEDTFQKTDANAPAVATQVDMVKSYCMLHFSTPTANTNVVYISVNGVDPSATAGFALYPGKDHYHYTQHPISKYKVFAGAASQAYSVVAY